jgi:hypothetical protein
MGVAPAYLINKIQSIQLEACRIVNGRSAQRWSTTHLLKYLNWLSVKDLIVLTLAKMSHKILTGKGPAYLTQQITETVVSRTTRLTGPKKLVAPPINLVKTTITKATFRYQAYGHYQRLPDVLKNIKKTSYSARESADTLRIIMIYPPTCDPYNRLVT